MIQPLIDAWSSDNLPAALEYACTAWKGTRDPQLGEVVRTLGARTLEATFRPLPRTSAEFQELWRETSQSSDLVTTGWLASTLVTRLPLPEDPFGMLQEDWISRKFAPLHERVRLLEQRCPDPRIGDAVLEILQKGKYGYWSLAEVGIIYAPLVRLLLASGDPSLAPAIAKIAARPRSKRATVREWQTVNLPPASAALASIQVQPLSDADVAALQPLLGRRTRLPDDRHPQALLEQVWAHPADDDVRAVLADVLMEAGDPRGTFIARQLAGIGDDDAELARTLRAHGKDWLGPDLATVLRPVRWSRGFLDVAELRANAVASAEVWEAASQDPRLATVRILYKGKGPKHHYERFVTSPAARDLRRIQVPSHGIAKALVDSPERPLEALEFDSLPPAGVLKQLAQAPSCASVQRFGLPSGFSVDKILRLLSRSPWRGRLHALEFAPGYVRDAGTPFLPRFAEVTDALQLQEIEFRHFGWDRPGLRLTRADAGWQLELAINDLMVEQYLDGPEIYRFVPNEGPHYGAFTPRLFPVPPEVQRVVLDGEPDLVPILAEHLGVPVVLRDELSATA